MSASSPPGVADALAALDFVERRFDDWLADRQIGERQRDAVRERHRALRDRLERADGPTGLPGLPAPGDNESPAGRSLRYWIFLEGEIRRFADRGVVRLAQSHALLDEVRERRRALARRIRPDEVPEVVPVAQLADDELAPPPPRRRREVADAEVVEPEAPRRNLLEILLDPRNIQYLLLFGGALMVVGVVILLWSRDFFTPLTAAVGLGVSNVALLLCGWYLLTQTRYQTAGRALTLLACLVMPLNLWYLNAHTADVGSWARVDERLWVVAAAIAALYLASALTLRDELFVWVSAAGVTMAGLLMIASMGTDAEHLRAIAYPASLLVGLGLAGIHAERLFAPEGDGPFTRRRFGLAFFWSGHLQLAAGLLLLLAAFVYGDWFEGVFRNAVGGGFAPSPVVDPKRLLWLSLALVGLGTYAYVYSDVVVRHLGLYVHVAAITLTWFVVLLLKQLELGMGVETLIVVLSGVALVINLVQAFTMKESRYTRAFPVLGLMMPVAAVLIGVAVYVFSVLPGQRGGQPASWWYFVGAMALTAASCRAGAWIYRQRMSALATVYHFAAAAATMTGAATLLAALELKTWQDHFPLLMVVPILYLTAAYLYKGGSGEEPLKWVGHAVTGLLLFVSLGAIVDAFVDSRPADQLNVMMALFFAEVALFYGLAAGLHKQPACVPLAAAAACGATWQLFDYLGAPGELHVVVFALVGLGLLLVYRLAIAESLPGPLTETAFTTGNVLLLVSFAATGLLGVVRLSGRLNAPAEAAAPSGWWLFLAVSGSQAAVGLASVFLVRHQVWRPLHVVATVGLVALSFLTVAVESKFLSPLQKVEVVCVGVGLLLLIVSHAGWYREQERESDLVTLGLIFGSLLVGVPLAIAAIADRANERFLAPGETGWMINELGWLGAAVVLFTTGFLFRLKATTIVGGMLLALYVLTLLVLVPWRKLDTIALVLAIGGGSLFAAGLVLSVFRESLLKLPERVRNREGVFRVLNWR